MRQESYSVGNISYKYKLYAQGDGEYILYLENENDPTKRYVSEPFALKPGEQPKGSQEAEKLTALPQNEKVPGTPLEFAQVTRQKLFIPMRGRQFALPDDTLVAMEGLQKFASARPALES